MTRHRLEESYLNGSRFLERKVSTDEISVSVSKASLQAGIHLLWFELKIDGYLVNNCLGYAQCSDPSNTNRHPIEDGDCDLIQ